MTVALVEPALYVFASHNATSDGEAFMRFWSQFDALRTLVVANDARLHCTDVLLGAINRLFPWDHSPILGAERYHSAAGEIIRFLEAHLVLPLWEYGGSEGDVDFLPPLSVHGIYSDQDVSLAWSDQLARHALDPSLCPPSSGGELLATCEEWSCATDAMRSGSSLRVRNVNGSELFIHLIRLESGHLPVGWLDPHVLERLRGLRGASRAEPKPDIDFEKTGHGPSTQIKRMLDLLGNDVGDLVVRIASDRHVRGATDFCKLEADEEPEKLRYRVGSGQEVLKGSIQTCARDAREQAVALSYIKRRFLERCRLAGFRLQPD